MGRIEHTLLDGEFSVRPNRPKTIARYHTIPQKVPNVSIYDKRAGVLHDLIQDYPGSCIWTSENSPSTHSAE
jgi:hypothetical protein